MGYLMRTSKQRKVLSNLRAISRANWYTRSYKAQQAPTGLARDVHYQRVEPKCRNMAFGKPIKCPCAGCLHADKLVLVLRINSLIDKGLMQGPKLDLPQFKRPVRIVSPR